MKLCFHNILHIADSIENTGPCWAIWQFPMERVCGMLLPLAQYSYLGIIQSFTVLSICLYKILPPQQIIKKNEKNLVFSQANTNEVFQFP